MDPTQFLVYILQSEKVTVTHIHADYNCGGLQYNEKKKKKRREGSVYLEGFLSQDGFSPREGTL